jgi:hypothetical protein
LLALASKSSILFLRVSRCCKKARAPTTSTMTKTIGRNRRIECDIWPVIYRDNGELSSYGLSLVHSFGVAENASG